VPAQDPAGAIDRHLYVNDEATRRQLLYGTSWPYCHLYLWPGPGRKAQKPDGGQTPPAVAAVSPPSSPLLPNGAIVNMTYDPARFPPKKEWRGEALGFVSQNRPFTRYSRLSKRNSLERSRNADSRSGTTGTVFYPSFLKGSLCSLPSSLLHAQYMAQDTGGELVSLIVCSVRP